MGGKRQGPRQVQAFRVPRVRSVALSEFLPGEELREGIDSGRSMSDHFSNQYTSR